MEIKDQIKEFLYSRKRGEIEGLAKKAKVDKKTLYNIIGGHHKPTARTLWAIEQGWKELGFKLKK